MSGIVHVIVFSNFEGLSRDPAPTVRWFEACSMAHPSVRWTHMYNPLYLLLGEPEIARMEAGISPFLLAAEAEGSAEVGLHLHMFYKLVRRMGVEPRACPFVEDDTPSCDRRRTVAEDPLGPDGGYDVLMTGYSRQDRSVMLDAGIDAFVDRGFQRPVTFCAGYSATDTDLQALLAEKHFTTSFAAQAVGPKDYGRCWYRLLGWHDHITPLTIPYRVSRNSILPPPHPGDSYLDLVEVPLNMGVDKNDLYLQNAVVSRQDMFDRHFNWALETGLETAVAIGVHADVVCFERWGTGKVSQVMNQFLGHIETKRKEGGVEVRYTTASRVAARFRENRTIAHVS